jgi:hypothetical protein
LNLRVIVKIASRAGFRPEGPPQSDGGVVQHPLLG